MIPVASAPVEVATLALVAASPVGTVVRAAVVVAWAADVAARLIAVAIAPVLDAWAVDAAAIAIDVARAAALDA